MQAISDSLARQENLKTQGGETSRIPLWLVLLLVLTAAVGLRWPNLGVRPMHNDEAVNAIKFGDLWDHGRYQYDPNEHHGPSLPYATDALGRVTRAPDFEHFSEQRLRWVTVLFGLGLIGLLPFTADGLGRSGTIWAAVFTATSPAMVFYSDYFIHEMLLVFFTFLALVAGWRYWRSRRLGWMLVSAAAVGLMDATKETFVIALAAAVIAVVLNQIWNRYIDASDPPARTPRIKFWHVAVGLGVWAIVAVILFSSLFTNPAGPMDSIRTYEAWTHRAAGDSPHIYGWGFYFHRLLWFHPAKGPVWTEGLILALAVVGAVAGFRRRRLEGANASVVRFLALYTFALSALYSLIAYKTPWCLLGFWHGMILLAGVGAAVIAGPVKTQVWRLALYLLLLAGASHLAAQAWALNSTYAADQRNPYVYAQTSPDILRLVSKIDDLATVSPQRERMLIKVMAPEQDYWPMPWYLRRFQQVGWWDQEPENPFAPVMVVSAALHAGFDQKGTHLMVGYFQLRPQVFFELYVEKGLWSAWLRQRAKQAERRVGVVE